MDKLIYSSLLLGLGFILGKLCGDSEHTPNKKETSYRQSTSDKKEICCWDCSGYCSAPDSICCAMGSDDSVGNTCEYFL